MKNINDVNLNETLKSPVKKMYRFTAKNLNSTVVISVIFALALCCQILSVKAQKIFDNHKSVIAIKEVKKDGKVITELTRKEGVNGK